MDGRAADADVDRIDGGSGDFACIGFSGIYIGNNWKCDGADWISGALVPLTIVKMFSSSAATGLLLDIYKGIWNGFEKRNDRFNFDGVYGNDFLYDVCVFYVSKGEKTRYTLAGALIATFAGLAAKCVAGSTCINKSCI